MVVGWLSFGGSVSRETLKQLLFPSSRLGFKISGIAQPWWDLVGPLTVKREAAPLGLGFYMGPYQLILPFNYPSEKYLVKVSAVVLAERAIPGV